MLVSPKWQTVWLESQHSSKNIIKLPSQQSQKLLEDLRISCCSPNKAVQLEALKCWGIWINNQNPDNWKVNTVCYTAVRPLISKKLQPLYKDVDICRTKLSLMWALLVKVQNLMHLEGPQYILEVFLQSCLNWLCSINGDECENKTINLIFQLLLGIFKKSEALTDCDKELFPPLSTNILFSNKVFQHLADKFLNIFTHWRKIRDKNIILKLWKHFLEHCELSCEYIPIPVWHKIFKLAGQICSEKNESIKERLSFLHSCAITLKSALSSSKFIDFGNLLTTPCEALFKKLLELCTVESNDFCDLEMFIHSKEICQVLSDRSVKIGGFDLCISVLDVLEEFCLRSLFWGVWCGLVNCYKVQLLNIDNSHFTKTQTIFYRKLRGIAVNFELDRNTLEKDCITEVEKHIEVLNIGCFCTFGSKVNRETEAMNVDTDIPSLPHSFSKNIVPVTPHIRGEFLKVSLYNKFKSPIKTFNVSFDLIKNILDKVRMNSVQPQFNGLFSFRFISLRTDRLKPPSLWAEKKTPPCIKAKPLYSPGKKKFNEKKSDKEMVASTPNTRSRKKAEEKENARKRKSFEVIVQEIVRKNKERKTEKKNSRGRRSPVMLRVRPKTEKKTGKTVKKKDEKKFMKKEKNNLVEVSQRKLRNSVKKESGNLKKKESKTVGKLENYFKVIAKKSGSDAKKEGKNPKNKKKNIEKKKERNCCRAKKEDGERKGEIAWRQTSLKTMVNEKTKAEKVKQDLRSRSKTTEVENEKKKIKKENKKIIGSHLAKLSPFKEVFHDHEYAKIQPDHLKTYEKVLLAKKKIDQVKEKVKIYKKTKNVLNLTKTNKADVNLNISEPKILIETEKQTTLEKVDIQKKQNKVLEEKTKLKPVDEEIDSCVVKGKEETTSIPNTPPDINSKNDCKEFNEIISTPTKKAKKRVKMLDSIKPSKKIKLDEEEKLPIEITEKENLEEKQTEINWITKKEKNDDSPKAGMISSRALKMIALVPESTKTGQIQRESPPHRGEVLKCQKAPNIDKTSRASKMLALLSENVIQIEEINEFKMEDINSNKGMVTTPKTPVSSLKSPNSIKKRRSIRFDDAKNETVLYQTDTPPSQILEEKEKCRRIKPYEIILNLP